MGEDVILMSVYLSECLKVTLNTCLTQNKQDEATRVSGCCDNASYSFIQLTHVRERTLTLTGIFRSTILRGITIVVKVEEKKTNRKWKTLGSTTT